MGTIAVTSAHRRNAKDYIEAIERAGGQSQLFLPTESLKGADPSTGQMLDGMDGLLLTGGPDIAPQLYGEAVNPQGEVQVRSELDCMELAVLREALERDLPVLAICRGMQLLNVAFGGRLLQDIPAHRSERHPGAQIPAYHQIYLSPGSKLAAILGMGGFFRVNSLHHQGLRDPQRSPRLLASAYSLEDGVIEGMESPEHDWVVGVQCHPERQAEVPKVFANLFAAFVERAERQ